jgi:predicted TIM-barrel fold metal-dependent hydrolase
VPSNYCGTQLFHKPVSLQTTNMHKRFYNCHAHCFTDDHVPEYFLSKRLPVSWLLRQQWLIRLIKNSVENNSFGWLGNFLMRIISMLFGVKKELVERTFNFIQYGNQLNQEAVIELMRQYYPRHTGLVMLTMDMEYMGAGKTKTGFGDQLTQLAAIKNKDELNRHTIFPFVFCDPRRIDPQTEEEKKVEQHFIGDVFLSRAEELIENKIYQGIKIYPALGYFPFDKRLKPVYDFAEKNNVPVLTHCTIGTVHFKYNLNAQQRFHPFLNQTLPEEKPVSFQQYYTHPLNYECLLNRDLLKTYWGPDASDYRNLKICIGHWGTGEDWKLYLDNPWIVDGKNMEGKYPSLNLHNWHVPAKNKIDNFSWFSIICDLMRKYPNVYADISYTLNDTSLLPLLKMVLETDDAIREKVLFGTDFYLVSRVICERSFAINVRAALGNHLFEQIAIVNAERYLGNRFNTTVAHAFNDEDKK